MSAGNFEASIFHRARLVNTSFRGSSLFGADFLRSVMGDTDLEGTLLTRTLLKDGGRV